MSSTPATDSGPDCSVVVPVYRNEENIPELLERLRLARTRRCRAASRSSASSTAAPTARYALLARGARRARRSRRACWCCRATSAASPRSARACGPRAERYFAVMSADLQEPRELVVEFFARLARDEADVVLGVREGRDDPWTDRAASGAVLGRLPPARPARGPAGRRRRVRLQPRGARRARRHSASRTARSSDSSSGSGSGASWCPTAALPRASRPQRVDDRAGRSPTCSTASSPSPTCRCACLTLAGALGLVAAAVFAAVVLVGAAHRRDLRARLYGHSCSRSSSSRASTCWASASSARTSGAPTRTRSRARSPSSCSDRRVPPGERAMSAFIHPQALCESPNVGDGTRIWAFAHVLPGRADRRATATSATASSSRTTSSSATA